jgi:hypothetical protein
VSPQVRQRNLLIVLVIALLIAALRFGVSLLGFERIPVANGRPAFDSEDEPSSPGRLPRAGHSGPRPGDRLAVLRLADLERVPGSSTSGRNPWSFVDPPRRPSPPAGHDASAPVTREAPPPVPDAAVEAIPSPEFTLRYLGRFGPPEKQIAVFTDGSRVLNRLEGGVIDGRFIVERVGYESVDIRYVDFPGAPARHVGVSGRSRDLRDSRDESQERALSLESLQSLRSLLSSAFFPFLQTGSRHSLA